jgi:hypothetical protein
MGATGDPLAEGEGMAWKLEGSYFETCSCEVVCPCTASLALGGADDLQGDALEHQRIRHRLRGQVGLLDLALRLVGVR